MPIADSVKILLPATITFLFGLLLVPHLADYLYHNKMWKKTSVAKTLDGLQATISQRLHNDEARKTPRMGGIIVWGSVFVTIFTLALLAVISPLPVFDKLSFLSRNQTWLPLFTLITASLIGLFDDYLVCRRSGSEDGGGLSPRTRLFGVFLISIIGAWWFYSKLEETTVFLPFIGNIELGYWFIALFVIYTIGMYGGGIIDGIDGLAGGIFAIIYSAYAIISFYNNQIDLAAFCMSVVGGLLVFLWFNIPPARFFLSETGTMGLTITIVVIAFLTKTPFALLIIASPLIVTAGSSLIQIISKRYFHRKAFLVAPLHNYFQAIGWPAYKVTMRYWVVSIVVAAFGLIIALTFQ